MTIFVKVLILRVPTELVLHIPRASEVGNQRVEFTHVTSFLEALHIIHQTVGCADVARKPVLTYKLSNAAQKAVPMSLASPSDWMGCLEDVRQAEKAKKGTLIPVIILVTEQVSRRVGNQSICLITPVHRFSVRQARQR